MKYIKKEAPIGIYKALASGAADINMAFTAPFLIQVDQRIPTA